jgi:hypothetical protein
MCFKFKLLGNISTNYMKAKDHHPLLFNTDRITNAFWLKKLLERDYLGNQDINGR